MANWDKLNTEFYNVLNTFSDEDWNNWESNRASKKEKSGEKYTHS